MIRPVSGISERPAMAEPSRGAGSAHAGKRELVGTAYSMAKDPTTLNVLGRVDACADSRTPEHES
jgi:hypothetical protein